MPIEPKETQRQLLERILESPHFEHASSLKAILRYLCDRSWESPPTSPKEHEIATSALGRRQSFDPKTDPIVRVSITAIRQRLNAYFESNGKDQALRLEVPKGAYRAAFSARSSGTLSVEELEGQLTTLRRFWQPYLAGDVKNMLVYTDVLFFRDDAGTYLRNIYVNNLSGGLEEIRKRLKIEEFRPLKPSFHFLASGEVNAMLSLIRLFAQLKAPLVVRNSRFTSWNELRSSNLILLGSSRTNSFLDSLQGGNNFVITADTIRNLEPHEAEDQTYVGSRCMDGKLEKAIEPALVTRRPGLTRGTAVTMISANHGRAVEGAANFLALEDDLARVLENSGLSGTKDLPPHFQLLLRVHMVDFDEEVINVERISHRVITTTDLQPNGRTMGGTLG
jgi:hypothetical protein